MSSAPGATVGVGAVRLNTLWFGLSTGAAVLAATGSVIGLLATERIFGNETPALADAAAAQDLVNLLIVAPLLVVLGWRAVRGHLAAYLGWIGCAVFTVYNYAIYAFSVQFGPLFLVWVVALGLSTFALIGGLTTLDLTAVSAHLSGRGRMLPAWYLMIVSTMFALLWLSEIVPDLLAGDPSRSAVDWHVPTSPVHVLDLAFFLPAALVSGALLLRRHPLGYATATGQLVWIALTCAPILVTPFVSDARGHETTWAILVPIGILSVATLAVLIRWLRSPPPADLGRA